MGRLAFLAVAAVVITGCGTVHSGAAGADPNTSGTATPSATGTPGSDPTGGYDPGPLPTTIGGMAAFDRTHDQQVGDTVGINDFIGMVNFFPVPVPMPPTMADVWQDFPALAMDACMQVYPSSVGLSTTEAPPNAGVLTLVGPTGQTAMTLNMLQGVGMYLSVLNGPDGFAPMSHYVLHGAGGTIPQFDRPLFSPGEITSLDPDLTTPSPYPISRTGGFTLKWASVPDGRPIYLFLNQQDQPEYPETIFMCKVKDDGEFTIPASVLANFDPTVTPFPGERWRDKIALRRWHYGSFEVPNGAGPILTAFESGWFADVTFQ